MIDTHCHLTFPVFTGRVPAELAEAAAHGVTGAITISTTTRDCLEALAIAEQFTNVWCTAGVHPLHAHEGPHEWANLRRVAASPRCVAWGELGLDNHYAEPARGIQDAVLTEQLAFIEGEHRTGRVLPIVIHCREAFEDLLPILRRAPLDPARFVFHCFTGSAAQARAVLDFGAMISFTGVVTYRNARDVHEAARVVPRDRIMVETDAPFLSPEPRRGERPCRPWMTSLTARRLADLRGEAWEDLHAAVNENTRRFFGIG
ncbi:MAG: TatD family hydrolase [Phycisphaerales bacterium]|nr:TatD family hydrolase [Phycisphaerales bacterium]